MREYAKVSPLFWTGETGRALRGKGPEAVIVALYLLTCPSSNMIGLYYLPLATLSHETGLTLEGATKGLQWASEAQFAFYDAPHEVVWVPEMARWQIAASLKPGDLQIKGVLRELAQYKKSPYFAQFHERYGSAFNLSNTVSATPKKKGLARPLDGPPKPGAGAGTGTRAGTRAEGSPTDNVSGAPPPPSSDSSVRTPKDETQPPTKDLAQTEEAGRREGGKADTGEAGGQGGTRETSDPTAKAPGPLGGVIENEPALQAVCDGSGGKMVPWSVNLHQTLAVNLKKRLGALAPQGLTLDDFRAFGQWIVEGGPEGKGGFDWMKEPLPTWAWLLEKPGRLEDAIMQARAWAMDRAAMAHKFIPKEPEKPESPEAREARFVANRAYRAQHPLPALQSKTDVLGPEAKRLDALPNRPKLPNPFAAHQKELLEETQKRYGTKEAANKERP